MAGIGEAYSVHELTELAAKLKRAKERIARMEKALRLAGLKLIELGWVGGPIHEAIEEALKECE